MKRIDWRKVRWASLFSGCGGLDLGLEQAGCGEVVLQVENDVYARSVLRKHWKRVRRIDDVRRTKAKDLGASEALVGGSPAKTSRPPGKGLGSGAARKAASGARCSASSAERAPGSSSSRTSPPERGVGCPTCGATCTCWGTEPVPFNFLPSTSARPTDESACSWLLPTPSASSYRTNRGGAAGKVGKERASLQTLAQKGLLPTLTTKGNYNRKEASSRSGDGVATVVGGPLSPLFQEWLMGFPSGWSEVVCSGTRSARRKRAR